MKGFYKRLWSVRPRGIDNDSEYARYLEVNREQLCRWKAGRNIPTVPMAEKLAKRLGVKPGWLLFGE